MSYALSRLTLYALLSAMERDLRDALWQHVGSVGEEHVLPASVLADAREKLLRQNADYDGEPSIRELLDFTDFQDPVNALGAHADKLPHVISVHLRRFSKQLQRMAAIRNRVMHSRPLLADDLSETRDLAKALTNNAPSLWRELDEWNQKLQRDPSVVIGLQIPRTEDESHVFNNLPFPDFDETGFIGRGDQVAKIKKAILRGAHPVISIIGDGGLGKTALALKVAYDIADERGGPFDAIVWTTAKASTLTGADLFRIKDAVIDSLGMFRQAATVLGKPKESTSGAIEELLDYLAEFRVLLILDNLETVLDAHVGEFLKELPMGSRVLITSRIGVGAFENRFKLAPMASGESVQLFRALANARDVSALHRTSNTQLSGWAERMHFNPGFIKWFVAAVQTGARPEAALASPERFLDFCMSNVYSFVSAVARDLLTVLLVAKRELSQAEIAFLSSKEPLEVQEALQELIATSMLSMKSLPAGSTFESRFDIGGLARDYIARHHPPNAEFAEQVLLRQRQLIGTAEELAAMQRDSRFAINSISTRSSRDAVVAKHLVDAMALCKRGQLAPAFALVERAKALAPDYAEVFRVEGFLASEAGDLRRAHEAYQSAVELAPESAPIRFFYASFLARQLADYTGAESELAEAERLEPLSHEIKADYARVFVHTQQFAAARSRLDDLLKEDNRLTEKMARQVRDLSLQYWQRFAESALREGSFELALVRLRALVDEFDSLPLARRDMRIIQKLAKAIPTAVSVRSWMVSNASTDELRREAVSIEEFLRKHGEREVPALSELDQSLTYSGCISSLPIGLTYGFVRLEGGQSVFFHRSALEPRELWDDLMVGDNVTAVIGPRESDGELSAIRVERGASHVVENRMRMVGMRHRGVVDSRQHKYAFVRTDRGPRFFLHAQNLLPGVLWSSVNEGTVVEFMVDRAVDDSIRATAAEIVDEHGAVEAST